MHHSGIPSLKSATWSASRSFSPDSLLQVVPGILRQLFQPHLRSPARRAHLWPGLPDVGAWVPCSMMTHDDTLRPRTVPDANAQGCPPRKG